MSSLSISGTPLSQYFQSISGQSTAAPSPTVGPDSSADSSRQVAQPHHHHHHGGGEGAKFSQVQSAVTDALQKAQADPSVDPNKAIQDALANLFQGDASTTDATSDPTAPVPQAQTFSQLLQSNGVTAQQFHQDFLTAFQNAQNGNVDAGTAFQSFPPGTFLDESA